MTSPLPSSAEALLRELAADGGEVMVWDVSTRPNPFPPPLPKMTNTFVSPSRTRFAVWVPARGVMEIRPAADGKALHELKGEPKARRAWSLRDMRPWIWLVPS